MACDKEIVLFMIATAFILPLTASATQFVVGDDQGWALNVNYTEWASGKMFHVGDTLLFNYKSPNHTVAGVDGANFKACTVPTNATVRNTGSDEITLAAPGKKWYICGVKGHCDKGMKFAINVMNSTTEGSTYGSSSASSLKATAMALVAGVTMAILF